ncbi:uncharacterized protein DS421_13g423410 [Arachis hypogaea]|nr:uncharacterized protein DS421_13g423410 [Arachis hypogaea]
MERKIHARHSTIALRKKRSLMAHSFTSPSPSKKTQTVHFRATFETEEIELVAKIRTLHQYKIELSINNLQKKRRYITQAKMAGRNQAEKNQTKDLKCATYLLSEKFRNMSEEKKTIVRDLGFGGLMHIPPLRVHHQILKELANSFKLGENRLETAYGSFKVRPKTIGAALGINASGDLFPHKFNYKDLSEDDKQIFRRFQDGVPVTNNNKQNLTCAPDKKRAKRPREPWIANWTREQLVKRMRAKMEEHMTQSKKKKVIVEDSSPEQAQSYHGYSTLEKEADLRSTEGHYVSSETIPDHSCQKRTGDRTGQVTGGKIGGVIAGFLGFESRVTHFWSNLDRSFYHGLAACRCTVDPHGSSEYGVRIGRFSTGLTTVDRFNCRFGPNYKLNWLDHRVYFRLSLVEESASEQAEENTMVVREETQSEALAIVPIQVCLPLSQTTTMPKIEETPETENELTPVLQIEGTTKSNPAPKDAATLMMMAHTASYVPKTDPMPSFSLGLTDSSQEEAATQEGASTQDGGRAKTPETLKLLEQLGDLVQKIASGGVTTKEKSPQIPKESGGESFEKFETPARTNEDTSDMKEKYYLWAIRVKTYADGLTNEFDTVCTLQAQDRYILSKLHLASLTPEMHIEAEIVSAMCFILNQQKIKRFQEEVYCLPPDIVNMALGNHPKGVFLQPKTNKPFRVEDYLMFISFLDLKKLALHRYIFAPVCHSQHWWLWMADTRKQKFYIVNSYQTKSPSDERTALNTFITRDKDKEIEPPYLNISGQKTSYDCAIYVMKWLEIFQPANIKRRKYEWDNWTQDEVDHFRVVCFPDSIP